MLMLRDTVEGRLRYEQLIFQPAFYHVIPPLIARASFAESARRKQRQALATIKRFYLLFNDSQQFSSVLDDFIEQRAGRASGLHVLRFLDGLEECSYRIGGTLETHMRTPLR
jgi:hypothetical protein